MSASPVQPLFDYLDLFSVIPATDRREIEACAQLREVAEGEVLLQAGKTAREFFFICSGVLKIVTTNEKGVSVVLHFLKQHQFCTILDSLNRGTVSDESIVAACPASLIVFSRTALFGLYDRFPYFKTLIGEITQQALLAKIQARNAYLGEDATTRYRKFLMRQPDIALQVPLAVIAAYLGVTQQSLSRIRRSML